MMKTPPAVWTAGRWDKPVKGTLARKVGAPFEKRIYFGAAMITHDLLKVPATLGLPELRFWSGIEETLQGVLFVLGIKLGQASAPAKAERLCRWLRAVASKRASEDVLLEMIAVGRKGGRRLERHVTMQATEHALTATAPVVVVAQWLAGEITRPGAFVPPDIVPATSFVEGLRRSGLRLTEAIRETQA